MALNFPAKIYLILENESSDIIRWQNNGLTFRIVDHGRFEREIIPKYFRHNQISSVQRQLNLYGFKCISRGEDKGSFFHPKFRRGDWEGVKKLLRFVPSKKDPKQPEKAFNDIQMSFNESNDMKNEHSIHQELWKSWSVSMGDSNNYEKPTTTATAPAVVPAEMVVPVTTVVEKPRKYVYVINGRVKIDPDFDLPDEFKQMDGRPRSRPKRPLEDSSVQRDVKPCAVSNALLPVKVASQSPWVPKSIEDYNDLVQLCAEL